VRKAKSANPYTVSVTSAKKINFVRILFAKPTIHKKKHHSKVVFRKGFNPFVCGGLYWTRTSDPIDVNDVLSARGSFVREKHELHTSHESP